MRTSGKEYKSIESFAELYTNMTGLAASVEYPRLCRIRVDPTLPNRKIWLGIFGEPPLLVTNNLSADLVGMLNQSEVYREHVLRWTNDAGVIVQQSFQLGFDMSGWAGLMGGTGSSPAEVLLWSPTQDYITAISPIQRQIACDCLFYEILYLQQQQDSNVSFLLKVMSEND